MTETFPKGVSAPTSKKRPGSVGEYALKHHDPESDKLVAKHETEEHSERTGNKEDVRNASKVKKSLDDKRNSRLKGHGDKEKDVYEAKRCTKCGNINCDCGVSGDGVAGKGKKLLLGADKKLKENTIANQIAMLLLQDRKDARLNELSAATHDSFNDKKLDSFVDKARSPYPHDMKGIKKDLKSMETSKRVQTKQKQGAIKEEDLDELSQSIKDSYVTAAKRDIYAKQGEAYHPKAYETASDTAKNIKAQSNRREGIQKASGVKESEGLDELSDTTLTNYKDKAKTDYFSLPNDAKDMDKASYTNKKANRLQGLTTASRKLVHEDGDAGVISSINTAETGNKPDFTKGMKIGLKPGAETQTGHKPQATSNSKSKKENMKSGEEVKESLLDQSIRIMNGTNDPNIFEAAKKFKIHTASKKNMPKLVNQIRKDREAKKEE